MRRLLFSLLFGPLLVVACGSTAETTKSSNCPGSAPVLECSACCSAGLHPTKAVCMNGSWACPTSSACICDAGATCTGEPPVICPGCCGGKRAADQCVAGTWTCGPMPYSCVSCDAGSDATSSDAADGAPDAPSTDAADGASDAPGD